MPHPGLYEQVINRQLMDEPVRVPETRKSVALIDKVGSSRILAQYLSDVGQKGVGNVLDNGGDLSAQADPAGQIVTLIQFPGRY